MHLWNSIDCGPAFSGMEASGDGDENRNGKHGAFHRGLLEGHGFNWEAVRKEDQKRFNSLPLAGTDGDVLGERVETDPSYIRECTGEASESKDVPSPSKRAGIWTSDTLGELLLK